ncbi:MAG TPA: hypothetical protein VE172_07485 [Stackebrandtia sp.]|jgi:hypothetical protein|uniref:hypothetical protein n=1 Tax=Stackebrandtia sp. TaxID=2023065 RepID=UPI002D7196BF|nr:hypothetical protein [Stackebrandtia sp.]HZE38640.1 hypothetical protein [Stackebrandtia sp.]
MGQHPVDPFRQPPSAPPGASFDPPPVWPPVPPKRAFNKNADTEEIPVISATPDQGTAPEPAAPNRTRVYSLIAVIVVVALAAVTGVIMLTTGGDGAPSGDGEHSTSSKSADENGSLAPVEAADVKAGQYRAVTSGGCLGASGKQADLLSCHKSSTTLKISGSGAQYALKFNHAKTCLSVDKGKLTASKCGKDSKSFTLGKTNKDKVVRIVAAGKKCVAATKKSVALGECETKNEAQCFRLDKVSSAPDATPSSPVPSNKPDGTTLTVPSRPTKFGAWFTNYGSYDAKWGKPASDGGSAIASYVLTDCDGNELMAVDGGTYSATVYYYSGTLDCMRVYAVNKKGAGQTAQHDIDNNP